MVMMGNHCEKSPTNGLKVTTNLDNLLCKMKVVQYTLKLDPSIANYTICIHSQLCPTIVSIQATLAPYHRLKYL